ncbi:MAG: RNA 2',3'-cyclic phosphodiesterase [Candidatus Omnitrophica bacterium CG11_big_fil_rev_8_21_14_0_20_42_13]|uniref:RNA 2',3'-cyclic phosphodiesterase n=1 Tax=Candidatus Ghiorseimicrobium undicola TaxID=1974746 RepID=A0A2H0LWS9_9BACT|nr:MAG: RNA 2',3'-cyclic phosphodiesterase [Candidatus Omnitrophica bacterium CG11_big_fil_rev_8_21_14_0_20_42_13]
MRTFIAIELSKELQNKLNFLEDKLKHNSADVKWVKPENIHLTLKFLGNTGEEKLEPIKKILDNLAVRFKKFSLEISGLGAFPGLKSPRVIWIGSNVINDNQNIILNMVKILDEELEKLGFPKEKKRFHAHATIGRVRSSKNMQILKESLEKNIKFKAGILEANKISLIQSTLTPSGSIYTPIHTVKLT